MPKKVEDYESEQRRWRFLHWYRAENKSSFPRTLPNGKVVHDELCSCGHIRSAHNDFVRAEGRTWGTSQFGHGTCEACGDCVKFTWVGFIDEKGNVFV